MKRNAVLAGICAGLIFCALPAQETAAPDANRTEAARFFEEYRVKLKAVAHCQNRRDSGWDALDPLIDSACALDPENPRYRREAIMLALSRVHDTRTDWPVRLEIFRKFIEQADGFFRKYPDYRQPSLFSDFPICSFYNLPVSRATEEERRQLSELFDRIRVYLLREIQEGDFIRTNLDLSDGVGSEKELFAYDELIRNSSHYEDYYDMVKLIRDTYRRELEFYRALRDFLRKHPEARKKKLHISDIFLGFRTDDDGFRRPEAIEELKKIFSDFSEMTELVREIDYPAATQLYDQWISFGELLKSDCSYNALKQIMFRHYDRLGKLFPDPMIQYPLGNTIDAFQYWTQDRYLYEKMQLIRREYRVAHSEQDCCERLLNDLSQQTGTGDFERIARFAPELRKSVLKVICSNALHHGFDSMAIQLCREESSLPGSERNVLSMTGLNGLDASGGVNARPRGTELLLKKQALLGVLNRAFLIRRIPFSGGICIDAVSLEGVIYLFFDDGRQLLHMERFNPKTMSSERLAGSELSVRDFSAGSSRQDRPLSFSASNGRLIVGGRDAVALYDLEPRRWTMIGDLPGDGVISAAVVDGRCYCLQGGGTRPGGGSELLSMCSFELDGSNRKLHFSARRADKVTPLDSLPKGKGTSLIVLPDGKLMFGTVFFGKTATLWSFDPNTERFEPLYSFENTCDMLLRDQGDFVLGTCSGFGERFFKFDKKSGKIAWFLAQSKHDAKWAKANGVRQINGWQELKPPLLLDGDFLISAGSWNCPLVLDLKHPEASPLLLVPGGVGVFRLEDGSWIFIGQKQLSVVKLK